MVRLMEREPIWGENACSTDLCCLSWQSDRDGLGKLSLSFPVPRNLLFLPHSVSSPWASVL